MESEACGNGRLTEGGKREWGDLQLTVLPQRSKVDEYDTDLWTFIDRSKWVDGWKYTYRGGTSGVDNVNADISWYRHR